MSYRTPLSNVKGLGTAKDGTSHFWQQRITGFANLILAIFLFYTLFMLVDADHMMVKQYFANPINLVLAISLILSVSMHMRLGMQVVIEDYIHAEGAKILCLILNTFFTIFVALAGILSLLKLSFGA